MLGFIIFNIKSMCVFVFYICTPSHAYVHKDVYDMEGGGRYWVCLLIILYFSLNLIFIFCV